MWPQSCLQVRETYTWFCFTFKQMQRLWTETSTPERTSRHGASNASRAINVSVHTDAPMQLNLVLEICPEQLQNINVLVIKQKLMSVWSLVKPDLLHPVIPWREKKTKKNRHISSWGFSKSTKGHRTCLWPQTKVLDHFSQQGWNMDQWSWGLQRLAALTQVYRLSSSIFAALFSCDNDFTPVSSPFTLTELE